MADTAEPQSPRFATDATISISSVGQAALATRVLSDSFATREAVRVLRDTAIAAGRTRAHDTVDIIVFDEADRSRLEHTAALTWYIRFAADSLLQPSSLTPLDSTRDSARVHVSTRPVFHALSIPGNAPNPRYAERFVRFVLSTDGQRILRAAHLAPLHPLVIVGTGAPPAIVALITANGGIHLGASHDPTAAARSDRGRNDSSSPGRASRR